MQYSLKKFARIIKTWQEDDFRKHEFGQDKNTIWEQPNAQNIEQECHIVDHLIETPYIIGNSPSPD